MSVPEEICRQYLDGLKALQVHLVAVALSADIAYMDHWHQRSLSREDGRTWRHSTGGDLRSERAEGGPDPESVVLSESTAEAIPRVDVMTTYRGLRLEGVVPRKRKLRVRDHNDVAFVDDFVGQNLSNPSRLGLKERNSSTNTRAIQGSTQPVRCTTSAESVYSEALSFESRTLCRDGADDGQRIRQDKI